MLIALQIKKYFKIYNKYIGKKLYVVFALTLLASFVEGLGIVMVLPLISAADKEVGDKFLSDSEVGMMMQEVLGSMGVGSSLSAILLFIGLMFLLKGIILFCSNAYESHLISQLTREMKRLMFDKYACMEFAYYCERNTGHFLNIINSQVSSLISSFGKFKIFISTIIATFVYISMTFVITWKFASMALAVGVLLLFSFKKLNNYVGDISRKSSQSMGILNKHIVQTLQSFKYLCATSQISWLRKGVIDSVDELARYMRINGIAKGFTTAMSEPIAVFFVIVVVLIHVVALEGSLGSVFVALMLFNRALLGIMGVQKAWQSTLGSIGSLELVEKEFATLEERQEVDGEVQMKKFSTGIQFRNVSFSYSNTQEYVLQNINLLIPQNSTVAIVGESGAGKSTLVDMLTLMLRPTVGEVVIDGVSSRDIMLSSWRSQIGYVSQETIVFDDTIANNISLWKEDYNRDFETRTRIELSARQAHAETFIKKLPDGFNTFVGDRGVRLSGGQRQRLFLARELYKKPSLLILDEATSALDSESEAHIQKSIEELKGSTTVVMIAHRLSTIKNADYIYVMDRGRVIEHGSYVDLARREGGRLFKMLKLQSLNI